MVILKILSTVARLCLKWSYIKLEITCTILCSDLKIQNMILKILNIYLFHISIFYNVRNHAHIIAWWHVIITFKMHTTNIERFIQGQLPVFFWLIRRTFYPLIDSIQIHNSKFIFTNRWLCMYIVNNFSCNFYFISHNLSTY